MAFAALAALLLASRPAAAAPEQPAEPARVLIDDAALDLLLGRATVARRLIELGDDPGRAFAAASQLTAQDIAVLVGNPRMLQRGGTDWTGAFIIAAIIIVIIVAVAASSSGSVMINV
jgi:hypothetical protein